MSLETALGRIDQILQLRQQLLDPSSLASSVSSVSSGGVAPTSGSSNFATALASAQGSQATSAPTPTIAALTQTPGTAALTQTPGTAALTQTPGTAALTQTPGTAALMQAAIQSASPTATIAGLVQPSGGIGPVAPGQAGVPSSVQAMIGEANSLIGQPYVWGGGHSGWGPQSGYDCSGFVSAVLHAGGYLTTPQDTQTLPSAPGIEPGPGQYVTIYDRTNGASTSNDHVIIDLAGQFYESGGEHGTWGGGGGVQPIATPPASYLATFNLVLHPAGL